MVSSPRRPLTQSQTRLQGQALANLRARQLHRATIIASLQRHYRALDQRLHLLRSPRRVIDAEGGIANPPPPYTPPQPLWNTAEGLWSAYKANGKQAALRVGLEAQDLQELSNYRYKFSVSKDLLYLVKSSSRVQSCSFCRVKAR
ncbi:hypothetical protein HBI56_236800 [Parastagonospora nodorum]|uniref:Uncharacterized protein n=1 Tax=Phaeosphaeria nodorum (strain SN15 / ATCC MYA-4574 / FGSC 10173) TaxID=321614 RepID=A0A7U2F546_PHANO|nr:hypothetical protein HBH56_214570 [Parastagonospora nodorum]QRC97773.1 hypothetical protein JI435_411010 [Parastagonospora nodorum SN15]KAH3923155.1 hypothetical protein HBH54_216240 [Parastagonospora nodorum]KAH3941831.1 hypothetical protein HBH53_195850 [Parastagonospora nodorum]KAH3961060.1 hypothetical protein HBH51_185690 [Parastagonospora nodorum]